VLLRARLDRHTPKDYFSYIKMTNMPVPIDLILALQMYLLITTREQPIKFTEICEKSGSYMSLRCPMGQ
jgi:hypothetical protein